MCGMEILAQSDKHGLGYHLNLTNMGLATTHVRNSMLCSESRLSFWCLKDC